MHQDLFNARPHISKSLNIHSQLAEQSTQIQFPGNTRRLIMKLPLLLLHLIWALILHSVTPEELLKHFQCNTTEPANKLCVPQAGGASCECEQGNTAVNLTCDIDECAGNKHNCNENAICENTKASFTCSCKQGYTGNKVAKR
uniref:EGF-like domain-containing protein n=1 Tax=Eptatretus burgeri TaxID=7764 RepID=A0A8C4Q2N5_EPTBU